MTDTKKNLICWKDISGNGKNVKIMEKSKYCDKQVVLITGCSSGVGKNLVIELKKRGFLVVATARKTEAIQELPADLHLKLDVTDATQTLAAIEQIMGEFGRIDILINNAGYSVRAAIEEIGVDQLHQMFDVNVFGIVRMIQAVAPVMRKQGSGKIINVGSVSGRLSGLVNGGYCAAKHSVNAISEATRLELKQFGIQVTLLEPGAMDTDFFGKLAAKSDETMKNSNSPYFSLYARDLSLRKKQGRADIDESVKQICKIIEKKKLKTRYAVSLPIIFRLLIHLPDGIKEKLILKFN